jgi:hypothetical protein
MAALLSFGAVLTPSVAAAGTTDLPLAVYGYGTGVTVTGTDPRFDLYVPDYRSARRLDVRFALGFPSIVDGGGIVTVRVDGVPIGTSTVGALRGGGTVGGQYAHFEGKGRMMDVSVEAHLTVGGKPCHEYDPKSLWMRVLPESRIAVDHTDAAPSTLAEFFEDYDGNYAVDVAPGSSEQVRSSAIALAYWLHQLERWRQVTLSYLKAPSAPVRTIVVGDAKTDLEVRGGTLHATPHGIELLLVRAAPTVSVISANGVATIKANAARSPATLDALGVGTRTQRGAGDLKFPIAFALGTFGGLPHDLHFHLDLAHSSYRKGDRAAVAILLNGAAVNGFQLSERGGTQHYDVPIDEARLGAANVLDVVVEFVPEGCARASMSASLLGSSSLRWNGVNAYPPTIGEFFNESSGHMGVAISDPNLDGYAFTLLDRLGAIDPNLSQLTISPYEGVPLTGVKEAVYVSAPAALKEVPLAWDPASGDLNLSDDKGKSVFAAKLGKVYGLIRALRDVIPSLVLTYTKSATPQALGALSRLSAAQLSAARSDLLLFDAQGIVYQSPAHAVIAMRSPPSAIRASWPLFVLFGIIVIVALVLIARRARKVS